MIRKKITAALLAALLLLQLFSMTGCSAKKVQIFDGSGEALVTLKSAKMSKNNLTDSDHTAYLEVVLEEAAGIIAEMDDCDTEKAEKLLFSREYSIHTAFDPGVFTAIQAAYEEHREIELEFGCAVTDLNGRLLAAFSASNTAKNHAAAATAPYSSFKPLSVYAPAIDSGVANWSAVYPDAPVKVVENSLGQMEDWPTNPSGSYSLENTTVYTGIQKSLNTIAVRCLQDYGVQRSIQLLKDNYGIPLSFEENKANVQGEDEVLGNIALGYLEEGVSPIDMADYYQVFATGGSYTAPKTITKILDRDGNTIYTAQPEAKQVMKETTAYIMNQLLQGVTAPGGTGSKALFSEVLVAGKTGTGEEGNWFIGITPQYSCAVWHGNEYPENRAAALFAEAVGGFDHDESRLFSGYPGLKKAIYCGESGQLFGNGCKKMQMGQYEAKDLPTACELHS